jgi:hypothetical protein
MKHALVIFSVIFLLSCTSEKNTGVMPENGEAPGQSAWQEYCEREKEPQLCKTN